MYTFVVVTSKIKSEEKSYFLQWKIVTSKKKTTQKNKKNPPKKPVIGLT